MRNTFLGILFLAVATVSIGQPVQAQRLSSTEAKINKRFADAEWRFTMMSRTVSVVNLFMMYIGSNFRLDYPSNAIINNPANPFRSFPRS